MEMNLDLRVAADSNKAERAVQYSDDTVRVCFVEFGDDRAAFPHINAAIELACYGLARGKKRDTQDLLCCAHFAKKAVGSLQCFSVPKFDMFVANGHKFVAGGVGVEAAGVHVGHVSIRLAQSYSSSPIVEDCNSGY